MDAAHLIRVVRRRAGLSQRALAAAVGVSARSVAAAEAGSTAVTARLLDRVLAAAELDLQLVPRTSPAPDAALEEHLRLPLTRRLRLALDPTDTGRRPPAAPVWHELRALARACTVRLDLPLALALWVPPAHTPQVRVMVHQPVAPVAARELVEVTVVEDALPRSAVPVGLGIGCQVWVAPPAELLLEVEAARLAAADGLLHERRGRDSAGRRNPPHRDPHEDWEALWVLQSKGSSRLGLVDSTRSRAWRLDAPVSLAQLLRDGGRLAS